MSATAAPGAVSGHSFEARPGHHLPPHTLSNARDLFAELGPGFTLISMGGQHSVAQNFTRIAKRLGIPLAVITHSTGDIPNTYGVPHILVRPDNFIAWTGSSPDIDATPVLRRSAGIDPA